MKAIHAGRRVTASCLSRSAAPAKSALRRSPEPGVVREAAFVTPILASSRSNCSAGVSRRRVNPTACSSRQKSLRGFAKCAPAAADTRPGLIPQNSTRRSGPRTSGIADSGCFGLGELVRVTGVEKLLEAPAERLAFDDRHVPRARLEPEHTHGHVPAPVAPRVALRFAERTQPHDPTLRRTPDGSC